MAAIIHLTELAKSDASPNKNGSIAYVSGFVLMSIFSNCFNLTYSFASSSSRVRYICNILSFATMPLSWTCGWMHIFSTIEYSNEKIIVFHMHCIVTLMGLAYIADAWMHFNSTFWGFVYTVVVIAFWIGLYFTFKYLFILRAFIKKKCTATISSSASSYMFQGSTILAAQAYLACETIGNCVVSQGYSVDVCNQFAQGTSIVGWQLILGWAMSTMLFDTGNLSQYKVLAMRFSTVQWTSGFTFGICTIISMLCYTTRATGVPTTFQISWCICALISMGLSASSVRLSPTGKEEPEIEAMTHRV